MPRKLDEEEHAGKRNEILDAAQRLVYTKGYEQMTIQDLLDELGISKGAFYHYFASKGALLEALSVRLIDEGLRVLVPAVQDERLSAIEKIHRLLDTAASWKTAQKEYLMALLRVWYADDNLIVRQKIFTQSIKRSTPLFEQVIQQGIREGVFNTPYPQQVGRVILSLLINFSEAVARVVLSDEPGAERIRQVDALTSLYSDVMERVLGAPPASLHIFDTRVMREWIPVEDGGLNQDVPLEETPHMQINPK
jgi:AcrR family transcriptional regulator